MTSWRGAITMISWRWRGFSWLHERYYGCVPRGRSGEGSHATRLLPRNFRKLLLKLLLIQSSSCAVALVDFFSRSSHLRWVFMSTSSTKRHIDIMGTETSEVVQTANTLVARFVLLTLVAVCRGCFWVVARLIVCTAGIRST